MSWTRTNPGAGDPWGIRHLASVRLAGADQLRTTTLTNVQSAVNDASSASWTAQAATAFASTAQGLIPEVQVIITGLETDAGALNQYAAMVEQIHDQALAVKRQQEAAQADLSRSLHATFSMPAAASSSVLLPDPEPDAQERARLAESLAATRSTLAQVEVRWDDLARQRQAADDTCAGTLTSAGSRGNLAGLGMAQLGLLNTTDLLQKLGGLTVTEITILMHNNPDLAEAFRTSPPDAAGVQQWWSGLDASAQDTLIAQVPIVIGNLEGIPYASRVEANKLNIDAGITSLEKDLADLEEAAARLQTGSSSYGGYGLGTEIHKDIDSVQEQIAYYRHLRDQKVTFVDPASGEKVTVTGHNVLVFDHASDAIAEYSGVLDPVTGNVPVGVQNLGIFVPGTGTTLANFTSQVERSEWFVKRDDAGTLAMITWKGGAFPQGVEAFSGGLAERLGQRLAGFGEGVELATSATVTGAGYSAGGSILGAAERAGLSVDRSLHVASAGMGFAVRDLDQYPATAKVPHYSLMAPKDYLVGISQSLEFGDLGHGGSPLTADGFTRLETGYRTAGDASSGQIEGHSEIWDFQGSTTEQMYNVIAGERVELYAEPEVIYTDPYSGRSTYSNPIMEPGYEPDMVNVRGGEQ